MFQTKRGRHYCNACILICERRSSKGWQEIVRTWWFWMVLIVFCRLHATRETIWNDHFQNFPHVLLSLHLDAAHELLNGCIDFQCVRYNKRLYQLDSHLSLQLACWIWNTWTVKCWRNVSRSWWGQCWKSSSRMMSERSLAPTKGKVP